jgi:hypothetical protein
MRARFLVLASLLAPTLAHADAAKAWTTAKANLPADASIVAGINVTSIAKTQIFTEMFPKLVASNGDLKDFLDLAKTQCGIDPLTAVQGVVVATDSTKSTGAVYLSLGGSLNQDKLAQCADKLAAAKGSKDKLTFKKDGNIVEVTSVKENKTVYYGWASSDVLVVPKDGDKAALQKWMGGKGAFAKSPLGMVTGKVTTTAAAWGATTEGKSLQAGMNMKAGWGTLDDAKGIVSIGVHLQLGNPAEAAKAATEMNTQIQQAKTSGGLPAMFGAILQSLTVKAAGDEIVFATAAPEKDVLNLAQMAISMGAFGGGGRSSPPVAPAPPPPPHDKSPGLGGVKP